MISNVFLCGVPKSGTTSIFDFLSHMNEISTFSVKEPKFFTRKFYDLSLDDNSLFIDTTIMSANRYFREASDSPHAIKIDASVDYFANLSEIYDEISEHFPQAKFLICLRNPIDRAVSSYKHLLRDGRVKTNFKSFMDLTLSSELEGYDHLWHIKKYGTYAPSLKLLIEREADFKVVFYEDLKCDSDLFITDILSFLGLLDVQEKSKLPYSNRSGQQTHFTKTISSIIKNKKFRFVLKSIIKNPDTRGKLRTAFQNKILFSNLRDIKISDEEYDFLWQIFKYDIFETQEILGVDLIEKYGLQSYVE